MKAACLHKTAENLQLFCVNLKFYVQVLPFFDNFFCKKKYPIGLVCGCIEQLLLSGFSAALAVSCINTCRKWVLEPWATVVPVYQLPLLFFFFFFKLCWLVG